MQAIEGVKIFELRNPVSRSSTTLASQEKAWSRSPSLHHRCDTADSEVCASALESERAQEGESPSLAELPASN